MAYYVPPLGQSGLFTLKEPFQNVLVAGKNYKVSSVRTFSDLSANGVDVFEQLYATNQLAQSIYLADAAAGVVIVTLETDGGNPVYVPNSYITSAPDTSGVPYLSLMVLLDLAILPENIDLSHLKDKLSAVCADLIGVTAEATTIVGSTPTLLTQTQANIAENIRKSRIATSTTDYAQLVEANRKLALALGQVAAMSKYIIDNNIRPPA